MITLNWFLLYSWLLLMGFFFYAGVMSAWPRLKWGIKVLVSPVLLVFLVADVLFDAVAGSLMFWELPLWKEKQFTFSKRCEYHWADVGFRGHIADAYCFLLNSIIIDHCQKRGK